MDTRWDIRLDHDHVKGRSFLLGNKRAFSVCLPAVAGSTDATLHPHKWFGAYLYGRKFLEGQVVRLPDQQHPLGMREQTGFVMGLTRACREYEVGDKHLTEEYFVPDGVNGFACTFSGDIEIAIEPEFDMRFSRALNDSAVGYETEPIDNGCVVSKLLQSGTFDDLTETFVPGGDEQPAPLFGAVQIIGDDVWSEPIPLKKRARRKIFSDDRRRRSFVERRMHDENAADHAPLWLHSTSTAYAPVRLFMRGHSSVVYGFGATREQALEQLAVLRDNLTAFQAQKSQAMQEIVERSHLETGNSAVDSAYMQVLGSLMNVLVARNVVAEDTALERPSTTILAGNGYFHDSWKRDENIALGFLLSLGFYDLAREIIRDTWQLQDERTGRLPQRIRAGEELPYHSSDGTLWALWRLHEYWRCTGDDSLLYEKVPMVRRFFERSLERSVAGLLPSGRTNDPDYLWETWMDTPHTPRHGFPVEIQMLWLACLRVFRPVLRDEAPELEAAMHWAESRAWSSLQRFLVRGMPADSLDEEGQVRDLITPNPYFCFEVGLDLGPEVEWTMRRMGRTQLAGSQGIVTLAPQDWERVFSHEFLSDRRNVRGRRMRSVGKFNYHRGVEWNWLAQFFVQAELKYGEADVAYRKYLRAQVEAVLHRGGIGGISELFDLSGARGPAFQSWSMSGFLEGLQAFAGVRIDVAARRITIEPQLPADWPGLLVRKWYGNVPFDLNVGGTAEERTVDITFPWGRPEGAELEFGVVIPHRSRPVRVQVSVDGAPVVARWDEQRIPGTARSKVHLVVPASDRLTVEVRAERVTARRVHTA
jgi:glycogen debranching enzyme